VENRLIEPCLKIELTVIHYFCLSVAAELQFSTVPMCLPIDIRRRRRRKRGRRRRRERRSIVLCVLDYHSACHSGGGTSSIVLVFTNQ